MRRTTSCWMIGLLCGSNLWCQSYRFEVASVKPALPPVPGQVRFGGTGARIHYVSVSLRELLQRAYEIKEYQLDGPSWLDAERFDVEATGPKGASINELPAMLRLLLEERFHLRTHWVSKTERGYALRVHVRGSHAESKDSYFKKSPDSQEAPDLDRKGVVIRQDKLEGRKTTMGALCIVLANLVDLPVEDDTALEGAYDFGMVFDLDELAGPQKMKPIFGGARGPATATAPKPTLFTALNDIGLALEATRITTKHLVIDSVARTPTGN